LLHASNFEWPETEHDQHEGSEIPLSSLSGRVAPGLCFLGATKPCRNVRQQLPGVARFGKSPDELAQDLIRDPRSTKGLYVGIC